MDSRFEESGITQLVTAAGGAALTHIVKDSPGKLFSLDVVNVAGATRYLYAFNNATAAGTALLLPPVQVTSGATVSVEYEFPVGFDVGCTISSSTTQGTYTAGGADFMIRAVYK